MTTDWLDKIIVEQAKFYGLSPASKEALFADAAAYDEMILLDEVEEPT